MGQYVFGVGETSDEILARIDLRIADILAKQKAEEESGRWRMYLAIAGALFAAAKLGVIAIPHIQRLRAQHKNPARRRRR